jgi:hypothetical protein
MAPPVSLRIALYLLVADGVAALYLADFLAAPGVALVLALLAGTWLVASGRLGGDARAPGARFLVPLAALASVADVLYFAEYLLDGLVRLLLFLVLYKLATLRVVADTRAITFLAFFLLVAASASAFDLGYLFVFLTFVGLVSWVALTQHLLLEAGEGSRTEAIPPRSLVLLAGVATATVFVLAAGLFFALPRIGLAALPLRARLGQMVTGFSDSIELGSAGSIYRDSRVVMRVHLPDEPRPDLLPGLRWRGAVLDAFDGQAWRVRYPRWTRLLFRNAGGFDVGLLGASGRILRQEVFLEPIGSEAVFAAPHALRFTLPASVLVVDDMGAVTVPSPGARLRYTVESELEGPFPAGGPPPRAPRLHRGERDRYLQLPALGPEIPALARQVAAGSANPWQIAERIEAFLIREFRYTLDIARGNDPEPLREFLLVRRAGHCEYFAAAMAVMLRTLGVPARVVTGFQRGEWNPYGQYFMVRASDAHSWVEAYLPGAGWTTFDPTPRALVAADSAVRTTWLYLDSLRLQWNRYVVNWSLRDQIEVVRSTRIRLSGLGQWPGSLSPEARARLERMGALALLTVVGATGAWYAWRRRPGAPGAPVARTPAFYRQALRRLARRGLAPARGETAREFSGRVAALGAPAAEAFQRVTALYERTRFGGATPSAVDLEEAQACVTALGRPAGAAGSARGARAAARVPEP